MDLTQCTLEQREELDSANFKPSVTLIPPLDTHLDISKYLENIAFETIWPALASHLRGNLIKNNDME